MVSDTMEGTTSRSGFLSGDTQVCLEILRVHGEILNKTPLYLSIYKYTGNKLLLGYYFLFELYL